MKPFEFFLAYLDTSGGAITDSGPDAAADRASLSERFLYKQAAVVSASYTDIFWKRIRLDSTFEFKFSSKESFRQIRFKNNFKMRGPWGAWVDMILIDTDSTLQSNMEVYKNLDQVWVGVTYDI